MEQKKKPTGTREWADRNVNIQTACENNRSYCYAAAGAQGQYGYVEKGKWGEPVLRWKAINSPWKIRTRKNVMFPSTHDITEYNVEHYLTVAKKLLRVEGVKLLIVSKPRLEIIKRLCKELIQWQDRIMFRFTIGSVSNKTLKYWEPDAPNYGERIRSLKHAYKTGYRTSVSIEPLLDMTPYALVDAIASYVTEAIWIGKMKHGKSRTKINGHGEKYYESLDKMKEQDWDGFRDYYRGNALIRWKNSGIAEYETVKRVSVLDYKAEIDDIMNILYEIECSVDPCTTEEHMYCVLLEGIEQAMKRNEEIVNTDPELTQLNNRILRITEIVFK